MSVESRRRAAENAFRRAREAGWTVEQDDRFHAWIEEWIGGHIEMLEVKARYRALLQERFASRRSQSIAPVAAGVERLKTLDTEIDRLIADDHSSATI